jgi:hypothetical protein
MSKLLTAIKTLKMKADEASSQAEHHQARAKEFLSQAARYIGAVEALQEVFDMEDLDEEEDVAEEAEPFPVPAPSSPNGRKSLNGINFADIFADLRHRHIRYPLAICHQNFYNFYRQTLISLAIDHRDYKTYVEAGGPDIAGIHNRSWHNIMKAVDTLMLDKPKILEEARRVHDAIYRFGIAGIDYHVVEEREPA